jgi:hypothetical protein
MIDQNNIAMEFGKWLIENNSNSSIEELFQIFSQQRMANESAVDYELRGYGIMPYNIKPIQAGIQYSHAIVEYVVENYNTKAFIQFLEWAKKFKTAVLLDGGTSCHSKTHYSEEEYVGTMEKHLQALTENGITFSTFYEPDMNNMLAGIFLIADERIFNKRKYPDFGFDYDLTTETFVKNANFGLKPTEEWIESIGGQKNFFLRTYLGKLPLWR